MKKYFYLAAVSAIMLTACSNDEAISSSPEPVQGAPQTVAFDTYVPGTTRAGSITGVITTEKLKETDKGFGVFAYYHDNAKYADGLTPNFMYNEHIHWSSSWTYSPLKYWPNETNKDGQDPAATSPAAVSPSTDNVDKLSFFAYAPYVNLTTAGKMIIDAAANISNPENGKQDAYVEETPSSGILSFSKENYSGDPLVEWKASSTLANNVDLLWGVAPAGMSYTAVNGSTCEATAGKPLVNMVKPDKDQKMKFLFQHALSRIGFSVVSSIDKISEGDDFGKYKSTETRVLIDNVKIYGNFGTQGVLNLNNGTANKANWIEASVNRTESTAASPLLTIDKDNGLLDKFVYSGVDAVTGAANAGAATTAFGSLKAGVQPSVESLTNDYLMVIPSVASGTTTVNVLITYHVVTLDTKLSGFVSDVTNAITKTTTIALENGKSYNLKLILGMTSVKLEATVADWQLVDDTNIWVPKNNE